MEKDVSSVLGVIDYYFPQSNNVNYIRGNAPEIIKPPAELIEKINRDKQIPGKLKYIIHTKIGEGPMYIDDPKEHLLDTKGHPIDL